MNIFLLVVVGVVVLLSNLDSFWKIPIYMTRIALENKLFTIKGLDMAPSIYGVFSEYVIPFSRSTSLQIQAHGY